MNARPLFNLSAATEALVGLALLVAPAVVVGLLLGDELSPTGTAVGRMLGIGLVALGISVWETEGKEAHKTTRVGICTYNLGAAALLCALGTLGTSNGVLLWPTVGLHGLLGAAMLWVMLARPRGQTPFL